jgi:AcrR family transcriptional regulator
MAAPTTSAPLIRRPRPEDAVDAAHARFLAGERVELQALAAQLDVSPATIYRWFGSRAQLLDAVLARLARTFTDAALAEAQGHGDERVCDYARRATVMAVAFEPVRAFVVREPALALRLILGSEGAIQAIVREQTRSIIDATRAAGQADVSDEQVALIVRVATTLVWSSLAIGDEPEIGGAIEVIRVVLAADR